MENEMTVFEHLSELRKRLLIVAIVFVLSIIGDLLYLQKYSIISVLILYPKSLLGMFLVLLTGL